MGVEDLSALFSNIDPKISRFVESAKRGFSKEKKDKISKLPSEERGRLAQKILELMRRAPSSLEEHLQYQALASVLCFLDPKVCDEVSKNALKNLSEALASLDKTVFRQEKRNQKGLENHPFFNFIRKQEEAKNHPFSSLSKKIDTLYRLINLQISTEGKALCVQKFLDLEDKMNLDKDKNIPEFIEQNLKWENELAEALKEALKNQVTAMVDMHPQLSSRLKESGGEYFYTFTDKEGKNHVFQLSLENEYLFCFRLKDNPQVVFAFTRDIFGALEKDSAAFDHLAEKALKDHAEERDVENQKLLDAYDLPKEQKIAHLN